MLLGVAGLVWWLCVNLRVREREGWIEAAVLTACLPLLMVMAGSDFRPARCADGDGGHPPGQLPARRATIEGPAGARAARHHRRDPGGAGLRAEAVFP